MDIPLNLENYIMEKLIIDIRKGDTRFTTNDADLAIQAIREMKDRAVVVPMDFSKLEERTVKIRPVRHIEVF